MTVMTCSRLPADAVQDLALADREPDIPRFLDVLSPARAIASLRDQFPRGARIPDDPSVVYLRYKPGISLTAAVAVQEPEPLILLQAVSVNHRPKVEKLLARQRAGATGWGVVSDPAHTLVAGVPASDRLLPGLRRRGGRATDVWVDLNDFRPLRYKPHRRWVGTGWHDGRLRVVRVVPPAAGQMSAPTLQHLDRAGLLPQFRQNARRGVSVHAWIDGQTLVSSGATPALLVDVGQALARLHALPLGPVRPGPDHRIALSHAADAVGVLCPALATRTRELAAVLGESLPADGLRVVSHGDFSHDQVVIAPDGGAHLIDFDRACVDHPAFDLGSFLSLEWIHHHELSVTAGPGMDGAGGRIQALLEGYQRRAPLPDKESLVACTVAAVLRRAVDPFRQRHPAWSEGIARRVELVERLLTQRERVLG